MFDYDGKRDRWNGYNPEEHMKIVEEYAKVDLVSLSPASPLSAKNTIYGISDLAICNDQVFNSWLPGCSVSVAYFTVILLSIWGGGR